MHCNHRASTNGAAPERVEVGPRRRVRAAVCGKGAEVVERDLVQRPFVRRCQVHLRHSVATDIALLERFEALHPAAGTQAPLAPTGQDPAQVVAPLRAKVEPLVANSRSDCVHPHIGRRCVAVLL